MPQLHADAYMDEFFRWLYLHIGRYLRFSALAGWWHLAVNLEVQTPFSKPFELQKACKPTST